jgi:hypothetical protein
MDLFGPTLEMLAINSEGVLKINFALDMGIQML